MHLLDLALEHRQLRRERQELALNRRHALQLLARVGHFDGDAVDLAAQRLDLRAPSDLILELPVDLAGEHVEAVQPRLDPLDELLLAGDAVHLAIEIVGDGDQVRRLLRALVDDRQLAGDRVHARVEIGQLGAERGRPFEEPLEGGAVGREPIAQLHRHRVRFVEVLDFLAQRVEILAALLEVLVLPGGPLGELVDLAERFLQPVERGLLPLQVVGVGVERLHLLAELIDALGHRRGQPVADGEPFHPLFRLADRRLQRLDPLVERVELLALDRELVAVGADEVGQRRAVLFELAEIPRERVARLCPQVPLRRHFARELLDAIDQLLGPRRLARSLVQLVDLDLHRPDHLVQPVGLDDGVLDGVLLVVERLDLLRDVLGERVERRHPLLGRLAHLLELGERAEALLDVLDHLDGRVRLVVRFAGEVLELGVVLRELAGHRAELVEVGLEGFGPLVRRLDLGLRLAEMLAEIVERRLVFLERVEAGACLERLRRQALERLLVLLQLAVRRGEPGGLLLGVTDGIGERLDAGVDRLELGGALRGLLQPVGDLVEARVRLTRLLLDFLQRLAGRGELRAVQLHLREHGAQRRALFLRGRNQRLQFVSLLLAGRAALLECVEHRPTPETWVFWGTLRIAVSWSYRNFPLQALEKRGAVPFFSGSCGRRARRSRLPRRR